MKPAAAGMRTRLMASPSATAAARTRARAVMLVQCMGLKCEVLARDDRLAGAISAMRPKDHGRSQTRNGQTSEEEARTLILTGASRGIGHATVKRFSSAGWRVITCSRHAFPENCPWAAGPEDHIQVDLVRPGRHGCAPSAEMRSRLTGRQAARPGQQCRHLAQRRERRAPAACSRPTWRLGARCSRSISSPPSGWPRACSDELAAAQGAIVNVTSIAGSAGASLRGRGLCHLARRRWPR